MTLSINGEEKSFQAPLTLAELLQQLGMKPDRVAVELNREIISRAAWPATQLKEGDRLEIVHFVGGGACAAGETRFAPPRLAFKKRETKAFSPRRRGGTERLGHWVIEKQKLFRHGFARMNTD